MGHYDEQREGVEDRELRERAERLGLTVAELVAKEAHDAKMAEGERLHRERIRQQQLIDYYLANHPSRPK